VIDSYAWIEYFISSKKGEKVKRLFLDETNQFVTVECCLAEIKGWSLKYNLEFEQFFKIIRANSNIISISEHDWIHAAEEKFNQRRTQKDFGLIDAVILIKQKQLNCKVISGDKHFRNLKNTIFLE